MKYISGIALSLFSALALAEAADAAAGTPAVSGAITQGLLLGGFIAIFYFLILRPQTKRAKMHRELVNSIQEGDEVVTTGGMLGKVTKVQEQYLSIKIAENVNIQVQKQAVVQSLPKGTVNNV